MMPGVSPLPGRGPQHASHPGGRLGPSGIPYFSQWESAELAASFVDGSRRPAEDPRWAASGAQTAAEYEYWSAKTCGLACLKMILAGRGLPVPATMDLVREAVRWRAYVPDGDRVAGLIYQPFAAWVAEDYRIAAEVAPALSLDRLAGLASPPTPVIASHGHQPGGGRRAPTTGSGVAAAGPELILTVAEDGIEAACCE